MRHFALPTRCPFDSLQTPTHQLDSSQRAILASDPQHADTLHLPLPQNLIAEVREHEYDHLSFMSSKVNSLGGPVPPKPAVSCLSSRLLLAVIIPHVPTWPKRGLLIAIHETAMPAAAPARSVVDRQQRHPVHACWIAFRFLSERPMTDCAYMCRTAQPDGVR